ncbi:MAG: hypothetical protein WD081_06655 [Gammaproteobacteria bacterium]
MVLVLLYLLFSVMVGVFARNRGRSLFGYFILSLLASPFLAFIVLLLIGPQQATDQPPPYD